MKSKQKEAERSRILRSKFKDRFGNKEDDENIDSYMDDSKVSSEIKSQGISDLEGNSRKSRKSSKKSFTPGITYKSRGSNYTPTYDKTNIGQKIFKNIASPVTYINDPDFSSQNSEPIKLSVEHYKIANFDLHKSLVSPYQSLKDKIEKSELQPNRRKSPIKQSAIVEVESSKKSAAESKLTNEEKKKLLKIIKERQESILNKKSNEKSKCFKSFLRRRKRIIFKFHLFLFFSCVT